MAAVKMFIYLFCLVLFAAVSCQETQGATCVGCKEQLICTKLGGVVVPCWFAARPYCVNGSCVAEPSNECR